MKKNCKKTTKNKQNGANSIPTITRSDQEMIDELDYEYKKTHKPYDKWERHWDEA